jgi:hypothetical protein
MNSAMGGDFYHRGFLKATPVARRANGAGAILAVRRARGEVIEPYFFRTHDGIEADLVLEAGGELEVIEIKLSSAPSGEDFSRVTKVAELLGARSATVISRTREPFRSKKLWSVDLAGYLRPGKPKRT